jgi:zinc protease
MKPFLRAPLFSVALAICCAFLNPSWAADEKSPAQKKALPPASEILNRYSKAVGGKDSFMKHNSQHATGTVEMPAQQLKGKMEVFAARPNKLLMKVTIPGLGETVTAFNGDIAWANNPLLGPMLLEGKSKDQIATQADFDQALHNPADYKSMDVLGVEDFNGEECYKLKLVHRTGFDSTEFFSVKTGLQRGFIAAQESPLGPITATTLVTDYKQFGDLFMPSRISQKAMGIEQVMTIEEMEYDKVDPAVFQLPENIKALLEKPAEKPEPGASAAKKEPAQKKPSIQEEK